MIAKKKIFVLVLLVGIVCVALICNLQTVTILQPDATILKPMREVIDLRSRNNKHNLRTLEQTTQVEHPHHHTTTTLPPPSKTNSTERGRREEHTRNVTPQKGPAQPISTRSVHNARADQLRDACRKMGIDTGQYSKTKDYLLLDRQHQLAYCPIEKIGSSFWKRVFAILQGLYESHLHNGTKNQSVFHLSGVAIHKQIGNLDKVYLDKILLSLRNPSKTHATEDNPVLRTESRSVSFKEDTSGNNSNSKRRNENSASKTENNSTSSLRKENATSETENKYTSSLRKENTTSETENNYTSRLTKENSALKTENNSKGSNSAPETRLKEFAKFLFVRDPYERLFSGFVDKILSPTVETGPESQRIATTSVSMLNGLLALREDGELLNYLTRDTQIVQDVPKDMFLHTRNLDRHGGFFSRGGLESPFPDSVPESVGGGGVRDGDPFVMQPWMRDSVTLHQGMRDSVDVGRMRDDLSSLPPRMRDSWLTLHPSMRSQVSSLMDYLRVRDSDPSNLGSEFAGGECSDESSRILGVRGLLLCPSHGVNTAVFGSVDEGMSTDRVYEKDKNASKFLRAAKERNKKKCPICPLPVTFAQFVRHVTNSHEVNVHFKPTHSRCGLCSVDYDFVGTLERFKNDVTDVLTSSGVDLRDVIGSDDTFARDSDVSIMRDVTERTFAMMGRYCPRCMRPAQFLRRTWLAFQIRGYLSINQAFPLSDEQADVTSLEAFKNLTQLAYYADSGPREVRMRQGKSAMLEAFHSLPPSLLESLESHFRQDCNLFGYDCSVKRRFPPDARPEPLFVF